MEKRAIRWQESLLHIVAWFVSTALLLVDVVSFRGAAQEVMQWTAARHAAVERQAGRLVGASSYGWGIEAMDRGLLLILACAGVALSVIFEYYFRAGLQRGLFLKRVVRVVIIEVVVFLVALLVQYLI